MMDLTRADEIELILNFMTFTQGYWEDEINQCPEAEKFITDANTVLSTEYEGLRILNTVGCDQIHEFIKKISEELIEHCKRTSLEHQIDDLNKWFMEQYSLPNIEVGDEIATYICGNLYHYGYKVRNASSRRKGRRYIFEKI